MDVKSMTVPLMSDGSPNYLHLDPRYDGGCPCATFEVDGTRFRAHCWRTCSSCRFAGLHYSGSAETAEKVFAAVAADWSHTEWTLVADSEPWYA